MEEEKAAAYYEELTRKGEGAARFKQGLGFSSNNDNPPPRIGSALASSTSFLSNFVKASNNTYTADNNSDKKATLESIHNKLNAKSTSSSSSRRVSDRTHRRDRSPSRDRDRHRSRRHRSRSRSPSRSRDRRRTSRSRSRERRRTSGRREDRSRSGSPRRREREGMGGKGRVDYSKLIQGYDHMTPAERVKAKMKLQLNDTAKKDVAIGTGAGWERFDFDKDAPLDDEEVEAADDDAALVKHIGKSFRFSTVEARNEEQIKAAHDEAMFGAPVLLPSTVADAIAGIEPDSEDDKKESTDSIPVTNLLSEKVLAKQQGSWRDRARK